jgi:D-serine ammonia-lyase
MEAKRPSLLRILSHGKQIGDDKDRDDDDGSDDDDVPFCLQDLPTPAFVVNRHAFASNCDRVLEFCTTGGWKLRPHIKTHKTLEGIHLQACGNSSHTSPCITGFVASTIPEVKLLVNYYTTNSTFLHVGSILYGVPISATKLPPLFALQQRLDDWTTTNSTVSAEADTKENRTIPIHLLMDHPAQIAIVEKILSQSSNSCTTPISVFVKLDTGYHRAGIPCDGKGISLVNEILQSKALKLVGLYSHWYVCSVSGFLDSFFSHCFCTLIIYLFFCK